MRGSLLIGHAQQHVSIMGAKAEGQEHGVGSSWALSIPPFSPPHIQLHGQRDQGFRVAE